MSSSDDAAARSGSPMGATRQKVILDLINRGEIVSVGVFAKRFGVSHETIRRDIRSLEDAGKLRRVHGGAVPTRSFDLTARRSVAERLEVDREAKVRAAQAAVALFEHDMNVYIGASSTMLLLADELARSELRLTVTTNMFDVAALLSETGRCEVTMLGGTFVPSSRSTSGLELVRSLESRLFDLCIMGVSAISPLRGILGPSPAHRVMMETVAERSHSMAVAADGSKFGRRDAHVLLPLAELDAIATDRQPSEADLDALNRANVTLLLPESATMLNNGDR